LRSYSPTGNSLRQSIWRWWGWRRRVYG